MQKLRGALCLSAMVLVVCALDLNIPWLSLTAPAQAEIAASASRDRDPWVVGMCVSEQDRDPDCIVKSREKAMHELAGKVFQKSVDAYFKARPIRNFFDNAQESKRKDDELRKTINEAQEKTLPDIEIKLVAEIARIKPPDWSAETMSGQVENLVRRLSVDVSVLVEKAADKSPYHKPVAPRDGMSRR